MTAGGFTVWGIPPPMTKETEPHLERHYIPMLNYP